MNDFTRRKLMALAGAMPLMACSGGGGAASSSQPPPSGGGNPPPPPMPTLSSIKDAAAAKNMRFGSAIYVRDSFLSNDYLDLMREHCNMLVAENSHKWTGIRPSADQFSWVDGDAILDFAQAEGMDARFHTLLWEDAQRYPSWFANYDWSSDEAAEAERLLIEHITTVARRHADVFFSWDVVNEAVDPGTGDYRISPFSERLGMEAVLDIAFETARAELPNTQLVYNDFMSWGTGSAHRDGVLRLLEGMLSRGTPIDALGLQSHVYGGNSGGLANDEAAWRRFLDEVTGMGLGLVITEFDVDDRDLAPDIATRDRQVADATRVYLDICFDYSQLTDVMCWGLVHRFSWLQDFQQRADGLPKRPTPFDDDFEPTLMAEEILAAFDRAAAR